MEAPWRSAAALREAVVRRDVSPVEVLSSHLAAIASANDRLNAFLAVDAEGALAAARRAEDAVVDHRAPAVDVRSDRGARSSQDHGVLRLRRREPRRHGASGPEPEEGISRDQRRRSEGVHDQCRHGGLPGTWRSRHDEQLGHVASLPPATYGNPAASPCSRACRSMPALSAATTKGTPASPSDRSHSARCWSRTGSSAARRM